MFARVRLPLDKPYKALLVPDRALCSDQGDKYLLIVNAENVVEYRRIKAGALQEDNFRVITEGLKAGEKVIVSGLQSARPRMKVQSEEVKATAKGKLEASTPPAAPDSTSNKPAADGKAH
jgi:multidrug efflux pump subunit AcrA (membrane-fusion protein)